MVSIILPVYNALNCLHRCLDSILHQSYSTFELIIVDDGSQDGSSGICDSYAKKDNRIIVFHQKNSGVSCARNKGLDIAQYENILFIDSDDYLQPNYIEELVKNEDIDLVVGGYKTSISNKSIMPVSGDYTATNMQSFIKEHISRLYFTVPWGKLYNNKIIQDHNIRFDKNIRLAEDLVFNLEYLRWCKQVRTIATDSYVYDEGALIADEKYHLNINELTYILSKCEEKYQLLKTAFSCELPRRSFRIIIACYPITQIFERGSDDEYYHLYQSFTNGKTRNELYTDMICSPANKAIYTIISKYYSGQHTSAKMLMRSLQKMYGSQIARLNHPSLFYRVLYRCIQKRLWRISSMMLALYCWIKKNR